MEDVRPVSMLRPYQRRAAVRLYREPAVGLLVDMGLGKTISTLSAVRGLVRHGKRKGALVVMPLRALDAEVWQQEAAKWEHTRQLTFQRVYTRNPRQQGSAKWQRAVQQTQAELNAPADIYVTTYENLPWLAKLAGTRRQRPQITLPDILVLDESSMIKNSNSLRFKALKFRLRRFFKTVAVLTGTPMPNSLLELWPQIYMLDKGARLGTSHTRYKERFFEQDDYMGYSWTPRIGATERVLELIQDLVLRLDSADWVRMPEIVHNRVEVTLPVTVERLYRKHERDLFTQLSATKQFTAVTAATLSMQCHQIANGAIYDDPAERTSWTELHTAKLDALQEIIDEQLGQAIMVAYWFRHDLERLRARWPQARVLDKRNTKETEADWNAGKIPLLFVQPRASGHALNMQHGGSTIVWFSLTWSREAHDQLIGRLRRPDQKSDSIKCHYIVTKNTVDEAVLETLERKGDNQRTVLDVLRAYTLRREHALAGLRR